MRARTHARYVHAHIHTRYVYAHIHTRYLYAHMQDVREIEKYRDRVDFHIVGASQGLYPVNTLR